MTKENNIIMFPYVENYRECLKEIDSSHKPIIYGRLANDYFDEYFINKISSNSFNLDSIKFFKNNGIDICYNYDVFDIENYEFSIEGYNSIIKDIEKIISLGFNYLLVSNPYIIEILCNEYKGEINLIISPMLEINSARSLLFFDVLNDISNIKYIILSQNQLSNFKYDELLNNLHPNISLILELNRFNSDNQIVYEHYYNTLYGKYNENVRRYLRQFLKMNKNEMDLKNDETFFSQCNNFLIGSIFCKSKRIVINNINNIKQKDFSNLEVVDFLI